MRKPMVTRTFNTTLVKGLVSNLETRTVEDYEVILPRQYKSEKDLLKAISKVELPSHIKFVSVVSTEVKPELRAMSEEDFIKYSHTISDTEDCNTEE